MDEEEIIKQIKNDINVGEFYGITEDSIKGLLDLYNKQKEEIKELNERLEEREISLIRAIDSKNIKNKEIEELKETNKQQFLSYETKIDKMEYEMCYDYISKDKIRDILLKFQNKYDEYLETTDKLFIGKEVLQYGEDILDEIAAELDIKLLEEKL